MNTSNSFKVGLIHTRRFLLFFVYFGVCLLNLPHFAMAQTVTFEKTISTTKKLVASYVETAPEEKTPGNMTERDKILEKAGFEHIPPSKVRNYSLFLVEGGVPDKLLWKKKYLVYSQFGPYSKFNIFDVYLEGDKVIVTYLKDNNLVSEIIDTKLPLAFVPNDIRWFVMNESLNTGPVIVSAVVQGSIKDGDLSVLVRSTQGGSFRFVRQDDKWVPQQTEQPKQLFSKPFTLDGKKWQLTYDIDPTATRTETFEGGRLSTLKGRESTLSKVPLLATGQPEENGAKILRQRFMIPNPSDPPRLWSGDVAVDEKTGKAYLAIADGSTFSLQIVSLRELVLRAPVQGRPDTRIQQQIEHQDVTIEADKTIVQELPFIDAIALTKEGEQLTITLNGDSKTQQQWIYSLQDKAWSKAKP